MPDWQAAATLVKKISDHYRLPYYTISPTYSICEDHGYIAGEKYECPICGKKTEVWSRITGYYRPVQNWNDGKTKEFADRKEYNFGEKIFKAEDLHEITVKVDKKAKVSLLFTTKTCPNCRLVEKELTAKDIPFEKIDAGEKPELVDDYKVMAAPSLVVFEGDDYRVLSGLKEIENYMRD